MESTHVQPCLSIPILNQSNLKVEQERNALNFDISLNGISVGVSHMDGESEQEASTHHSTEFYGKDVTLVVNKNLEIEGAMIDGEAVLVDAKEITVKDVIDRVKSRSSFVQMGVGVMFSFWTGSFTPQMSASTGGSVKESDLVQFVSGITGENVDVTADKITSSLDALSQMNVLRHSGRHHQKVMKHGTLVQALVLMELQIQA